MDWFKKHADTAVVLTALFGAFVWMQGNLFDIHKEIADLKTDVAVIKSEMVLIKSEMKTEMAVIKTVLIMQNVMPKELAVISNKDE